MSPFLFIGGHGPPSEETITMTDMNLRRQPEPRTHPAPLHAGSQAGEAAGKARDKETSWGKQIICDGKKGESFPSLTRPHFTITLYHICCGLLP